MPPTNEQFEEAVQYAAEVVDKMLPAFSGGNTNLVADRTALRAAMASALLPIILSAG
jgi:hypothetical protein